MSKKNAAELFGKKPRSKGPANVSVEWKLPDQYVGLEIEIEQTKKTVWPEHFWPNWTQTRDGSLRNGREYVLSMPLKGDALSKAIANLFHGSSWERSTTGSTHIHLDMMEESTTIEVIKVLTMLIYSMEDAIFRYLGVGREWCGFTNKLSSAPEALLAAVLNSTDEDNYRDLFLMCHDNGGNIGRYYGLNLLALSRHNTVEFRYFPTATTQDEVIEWVQMVMSFKKAATELGTLENLVATFSNEDSYFRFVSTYFAEWAEKFLSTVPHYRAMGMIKKALAVAESKRVVEQPYQFNSEAITANPVLARFVVVPQAPVPEYHFILPAYHDAAPDVRQQLPNTTMLYQGDFYLSSPTSWLLYTDVLYDSQQDRQRAMHAALSNVEITRQSLMAIGYGSSNATYAVSRHANITAQLANALGLGPSSSREDTAPYVPPASWRPPMDEVEHMDEDEPYEENEDSEWQEPQEVPQMWSTPTVPQPVRPRSNLNEVLRRYNQVMWADETTNGGEV